jgi:hypothetical protein
MDYTEDKVLTQYLLRNYCHFLTDVEWMALKVATARDKGVSQQLQEIWPGFKDTAEDPAVVAALAEGVPVFLQRLREELLQNPAVVVKRCPACQRVLRTPLAKQCFWCGESWHEG